MEQSYTHKEKDFPINFDFPVIKFSVNSCDVQDIRARLAFLLEVALTAYHNCRFTAMVMTHLAKYVKPSIRNPRLVRL